LEKVAGELMEKGGSGYWRGWTEFWRFIRDH
jgi:hypothetical protein